MPASTNALDSKSVADNACEDNETAQHWTEITQLHAYRYLLLPMLAVAGLTACVRCFDLDVRVSRLFFDSQLGKFGGENAEIWLALYRYGPVPGLVLGIVSTIVFAAGFVWQPLRPFRQPCAFMALLLALGPGLIVNGILKASWDRPRPCELVEFGGDEEFVPVLNLRIIGEHISKSFPSGHAAMGFYLLAPAFVLTRKSRRWTVAIIVLGLTLGLVMGFGRVAQGRHFPSDVLWAGAIVYFSGMLLAYILHPAKIGIGISTFEERGTDEERIVLRIEGYSQKAARKADTQVPVRDAPKRRAA